MPTFSKLLWGKESWVLISKWKNKCNQSPEPTQTYWIKTSNMTFSDLYVKKFPQGTLAPGKLGISNLNQLQNNIAAPVSSFVSMEFSSMF